MKKSLLYLSMVSMVVALAGCTSMSATGSDTAAIKSTRGSASAQITRAEAEQYARQQQVVSNELDLERKKRRNTTDAINDTTGTIRNISNLIRSF